MAEQILGDFDGDGVVDMTDAMELMRSFGRSVDDPECNPLCDLNGDGVVDILDLNIMRGILIPIPQQGQAAPSETSGKLGAPSPEYEGGTG